MERSSLLTPKTKAPKQTDRIPYVTTFCPQAPDLRTTHNKHKHILEASNTMSKLVPNPPLIAHRRTPNLGNLLFNTRPPRQPKTGTHPCRDIRCQLNYHLITGNKVTSTRTKYTHTIPEYISCNTTKVIYVITCTKCNTQYTGQTGDRLRIRINQHLSAITHNKNQPVSRHFNLPGHDVERDFRVQGVRACQTADELNEVESQIMWRLGSHRDLGGLNINEPFLHPFSITT